MFSFARRRAPRNPAVHKVIQRFLDAVNPELASFDDESRSDYRSCRTVPVVLAPCEDEIVLEEACYALTKNLSVRGLALVLPQPFRAERVVVGFWFAEQPHFVAGEVRQNVPLGGGFWQLGVEATAVFNPGDSNDVKRLLPLAARLDPRVNRQTLVESQIAQH
jgi:hypothetical protein